MKKEIHVIQVDEKNSVSSSWLLPENYKAVLLIAHGAGNDMNSDFITFLHHGFAKHGIATVKFNFPYKEKGRKSPDRAALLEATWLAMVNAVLQMTQCRPEQLYLSGKSMGGRYASLIANKLEQLGGLMFFGFPLHSPGKPDRKRADHLTTLNCPMLFIQGTRDSLCDLDTLKEITGALPSPPTIHVVVGGDHSFKVLKRLNRSLAEVMNDILLVSVNWIELHI